VFARQTQAKAGLAAIFTPQVLAGLFLMADIGGLFLWLWRKLNFLWRILSGKASGLWRKLSPAMAEIMPDQQFGLETKPHADPEKGRLDQIYEG
jgi:hypothetical protein